MCRRFLSEGNCRSISGAGFVSCRVLLDRGVGWVGGGGGG